MGIKYTDSEINEAIREWETHKPNEVVREELGGDYYYRCGWLLCNKIVKADYDYCPYCGTKLIFPL